MSLRIRKGDKVMVLAGRDKGKSGKVIHVYPKIDRALVEGVNMVKKHQRRSQQHPQGAVIQKELPIHISNLSLADGVSGKASRIHTLVAKDGSKERVHSKKAERTKA